MITMKIGGFLEGVTGRVVKSAFKSCSFLPFDEKHVSNAIQELGFFTHKVNVLGVYLADKKRAS